MVERKIRIIFLLPLVLPLIFLILQAPFTGIPGTFILNFITSLTTIVTIQAAVALPSVLFQNEMFYDLSGAGSFLMVVWGSGPGEGQAMDWRQGVVSGAVALWAGRLGIYTFVRALLNGGDSRFETIRTDPKRFSAVFVAQGIWVTVCTLPVVALNSVPAEALADMTWKPWALETIPHAFNVFWFWLGMWSFSRGLAIECIADWQLQKWRWDKREKKHDEAFCARGMWARSRHPNYYGECLVWLGVAMSCSAVLLSSSARQATKLSFMTGLVLCCVTPWFVYKLLRQVSVPVIENKYDRQFVSRYDYRTWRRSTSFRIWL